MQSVRKDFPGIKEMREAARQQIKDWGWPDKYYRDEMPHKACSHVPQGSWKIQGFGMYQNADWQWTRYVAYRCPKCGWMIQVNQFIDQNSEETGSIHVLEVQP